MATELSSTACTPHCLSSPQSIASACLHHPSALSVLTPVHCISMPLPSIRGTYMYSLRHADKQRPSVNMQVWVFVCFFRDTFSCLQRAWLLGPKHIGPNILVAGTRKVTST